MLPTPISFFFFFNDTATTEIYTLSLHDALPISIARYYTPSGRLIQRDYKSISLLEYYERKIPEHPTEVRLTDRSEEHTSELQSRLHLVCRLLLEKKNKKHLTVN